MGSVSVVDREKNGGERHEGMGRNQRIKKMGCLNGFPIYFKVLGFKLNDSNTFKPNLEILEIGFKYSNLNQRL
jgi:hypothetical protein